MGLAYITASLERLVLFLYPTMVVLLSAVMRGRPITRRAVVALIVSYAGIAFVFAHDLSFGGDKTRDARRRRARLRQRVRSTRSTWSMPAR